MDEAVSKLIFSNLLIGLLFPRVQVHHDGLSMSVKDMHKLASVVIKSVQRKIPLQQITERALNFRICNGFGVARVSEHSHNVVGRSSSLQFGGKSGFIVHIDEQVVVVQKCSTHHWVWQCVDRPAVLFDIQQLTHVQIFCKPVLVKRFDPELAI